MMASYRQLISEHESIEEAADALLADASDEAVGAADVAASLGELARLVEAHLEVEDQVVAAFDLDRLNGPWVAAWQEGLAGLERLKEDWIAFLAEWDRTAIQRDRRGFRSVAATILSRLRERVQLETRAFYATALHSGAIALR